MSTWNERLKEVIGPRGYDTSMRRSLQTVILYEAKRCIAPRLVSLRPFQKKYAFMDQAKALIASLDFLYPQQKAEILWRTYASKEQLTPDVAWKRAKIIEKELTALAEEIRPFMACGRSHQEAVNLLVQNMFEKSKPDAKGNKLCPAMWEHAHNHLIMAFRLYYDGDIPDPNFPAAVPPKAIVVPSERPKKGETVPETTPFLHIGGPNPKFSGPDSDLDIQGILGENSGDERRKLLKEVRDHLDLLKEFEGSISEEDLAKRKRELFLALPPAPPPAVGGVAVGSPGPLGGTPPSSKKAKKK